MGRGKKFLSLFLAAAMTVTGINVGVPATVHAQTADEAVSLPKKLAFFSFDNEKDALTDGTVITADDGIVSGDDGTVGGEQKVTTPEEGTGANVTATVAGDGASLQSGTKRAGTKALRLSGNTFLTVMAGEDNLLKGREQLTVSFWSNVTGDAASRNWPFYAGKAGTDPTAKDGHIGVAYNGNTVLFSRGKGTIVSGSNGAAAISGDDASADTISGTVEKAAEWNFITVVMEGTKSTLYINGEKASDSPTSPALSELFDENSRLQIGKANIGAGEGFTGFIDDFSLYGAALTSDQVKADYDSYFKTFPVKYLSGEKDITAGVKEPLSVTLPYDRTPDGVCKYDPTKDESIPEKIMFAEGTSADEKPYVRAEGWEEMTLGADKEQVELQYEEGFLDYTVKYVTGEGESQKEIADSKAAWLDLTDPDVSAETFVYELTDAEKEITGEGGITYVPVKGQELKLVDGENGKEIVIEYEAEVNQVKIELNYVYEETETSTIAITKKEVDVDKSEDGKYTYKDIVSADDGRIISDTDYKVYTPLKDQGDEEAQPGKDGKLTLTVKCEKLTKPIPVKFVEIVDGEDVVLEDKGNVDIQEVYKDDVSSYTYEAEATYTKPDTKDIYDLDKAQSKLTITGDIEGKEIKVVYTKRPADQKMATVKYVFGGETVATGADEKPLVEREGKYYYVLTAEDITVSVVASEGIEYLYKVDGKANDEIEAVADTENEGKYILPIPCVEDMKEYTVVYKCGDLPIGGMQEKVSVQKIKDAASYEYVIPGELEPSIELEGTTYVLKEGQSTTGTIGAEETEIVIEYVEAQEEQKKATVKYVFGEETVATGADKKPLTKEGEKYYYTLTEADVDQRIVADSEIKYVYITTGEAGAKIEAVADTEGNYTVNINCDKKEENFDVAYRCNGTVLNQDSKATVTLSATDEEGVDVYTFDPQTQPQTINIDGKRYDRIAGQNSQTRTGEDKTEFTVEYKLFKTTLIADYSFDAETEEGGWADATGHKGNAVKDGEATVVEGLIGNAVQLPGGTQNGEYPGAIKLPDNLLEGLDDFTISVFNKRTSNRGTYAAISLLGSDGHANWSAGERPTYIGLLNRGNELALVYQNGSEIKQQASVVPVNEWAHFVIVVSGSTEKVILYKDGVKAATVNAPGMKPSEMLQKNNFLGRSAWTDPDFAGAFDELKVYDGALSEEEAQAVYNGEKTKVERQEFSRLIETAEELVTTTDAAYPQSARDALILAIATAKNASDAEIAEASEALQGAIDRFRAAAVDKTTLQAQIAAAEGKVSDATYPDAARKALQAAIDAAKGAEALTTTTQAAIDKATNDLAAAIATFELSKDKKALTDRIEEAKHKANDTSYSEEARNALKAAIATAESAAENETTSNALKTALATLNDAIIAFEETKPDPIELNKKPLTDKITEAAEKAADTSYSEEARNTLLNAIIVAQLALSNATTQKEIDDAAATLGNAIKTFEDSKVELNKTALTNKITEATQKAADTSYSEEARNALENAILVAELVLKNATTQAEIDKAEAALANAIKVFENSKVVLDKTDLTNKITEATQKAADTSYTEEARKALTDAIAAAEEAAKNATTQKEIDDALTALNKAITIFEASEKVADKTALNNAIQEASALKENDYTPSTWKTLKDALTAAQAISAKADATQEEIDNALDKLNDAKNKLVKATKVNKLTISGNKKLRIAAGQKVSLKAVVAPENATNKTLKWRVGNKNKNNASVDQNGVVTTTKKGAGKKVVVAVRSQDGSKLRAAVTVVIMKHAVKSVKLSAKGKTVKNGTFTAKVGEKVKLVPEVSTTGKKANKELSWKSSNNKYVKVGSKGVIKVKAAGKGKTVTITATSTDGTNKKATIKVKIK